MSGAWDEKKEADFEARISEHFAPRRLPTVSKYMIVLAPERPEHTLYFVVAEKRLFVFLDSLMEIFDVLRNFWECREAKVTNTLLCNLRVQISHHRAALIMPEPATVQRFISIVEKTKEFQWLVFRRLSVAPRNTTEEEKEMLRLQGARMKRLVEAGLGLTASDWKEYRAARWDDKGGESVCERERESEQEKETDTA